MAVRTQAHDFDDPLVPHPARRYNYWLGGRENYKVDRAAGDAVAAAMPTVRVGIWENRAFLRRAVRFMIGEGIRQVIDIGPGIPAPDCSHQVAQGLEPETRVLYVDNDPIVIAYSRALLRGSAIPAEGEDEPQVQIRLEGAAEPYASPGLGHDLGDGGYEGDADYGDGPEGGAKRGLIGHVLADVCEPERILSNAETQAVIDFSQPVGLLMVAVAHFCIDDDAVFEGVAKLIDALPSGSIVAFSHAATDYLDPRVKANVDAANRDHRTDFVFRYTFEVARFATGLEVLEPGVVPVSEWRAEGEPEPRPTASDTGLCAWVARKP